METRQTRSYALIFLLGVLVALLAGIGIELVLSKPGYRGYKDRLAIRETIPLAASPIPSTWVISGSPSFRSNTFGRSHDNASSSGIWECAGPTQFVWTYEQDETIYILEGSAEIEYLGKSFTLKAGDSTHFAAGTSANWNVRERIRKTWVLYEPGRLVRAMRRMLG